MRCLPAMIFDVCSVTEIEAAFAKMEDNAAHACAALRELPALENNRKLPGDLVKMAARPERFRYVFFMSPLFPKTERQAARKRDGVQVWPVSMKE